MNRGQFFKNWKKTCLTIINIFILAIAFAMVSPCLLILRVFSYLTFPSADLVSTCPLSRFTMTLALAVGLVPTMYDYEWKAAT